jgi:2-polyprenyl-3-methyl-5-hydroxy-6-metoxy-1,4-benzoquinol methylase
MKADFVSLLRCPARDCNAQELRLHAGDVERIEYKGGAVDEVREGTIECPACGRQYPIQEYVPSFEQLYPEGLRHEAEHWGKWYGFMWERGFTGFFDLRNPVAPLITEGIEVLNPGTVDGIDIGGTHSIIADHPLLVDAELLLDIGSGTGWSSLYFARCGHRVVAFDPAVANMRLAKRYAISQGEYIEYMGAAMGFLNFKPEVFDAAVALHSIHHVPNLVEERRILKGWLRDGAGIGIDEHVRNKEYLEDIMSAARKWAQEEIYPGLRTLDPEVLAGIPRAEPSEMEAVGSEHVIEAFIDNFEVDSFDGRYIAFDSLS